MFGLEALDTLYVLWAFFFQLVLVIYFALRKWNFDLALRVGWVVYGLGIPAAVVSLVMLVSGKEMSFWIGGFLYLAWGTFGITVEYVRDISWRNPVRWPFFIPYVFLYLGTVMFYWWPLGQLSRPLWFVCTLLVIVGMALNITSHKKTADVPAAG